MSVKVDVLEPKFNRVYREIDRLKSKVHKKSNFFFFKWHRYSIEDLLHSKHLQKVHSICGKIADDVRNWKLRERLSRKQRNAYHLHREKVERRLGKVEREIRNRRPTWLEQIVAVFKGVIRALVSALPMLRDLLPLFRGVLRLPLPGRK